MYIDENFLGDAEGRRFGRFQAAIYRQRRYGSIAKPVTSAPVSTRPGYTINRFLEYRPITPPKPVTPAPVSTRPGYTINRFLEYRPITPPKPVTPAPVSTRPGYTINRFLEYRPITPPKPVTPAPVSTRPGYTINRFLEYRPITPPKPVTPAPVIPAPVIPVQKIVDVAIKTPVSDQAKATAPIIAKKVKRVLPVKNETVNLISPLVAEKLQARGIMPEDATKEDVKDVLVEVSKESGFLGLPWYVPLAGAGLIGLILIKRKR